MSRQQMRSAVIVSGVSSLAAIVSLIACSAPYGAGADIPSGDDAGDDAATGPGSDATNAADGSSADVAQPPGCAPLACALLAPPSGWELVLLGTARTDACPAGFDSADPIESPMAGKNACGCGACLTTGTNCSTGTVPTTFDQGSGVCGQTGASLDANGGACKDLNGTLGQHARIGAPTAVLGTCTSVGAGNRASVVAEARRLCTRQASGCSAGACTAPPSMKACIASPGDVACPPGASTKHLVGADFALTCTSCSCTIAAATCGGSLDFFPQAGCAGAPVSLSVGGVCTATGAAPFMSTKLKPLVASETCSTVPGAPTTTLTATQTVCCP